jgi:hypothetical protein
MKACHYLSGLLRLSVARSGRTVLLYATRVVRSEMGDEAVLWHLRVGLWAFSGAGACLD